MNYPVDHTLLSSIPLFQGLATADLDFLANHLRPRFFKTGDIVIQDRERGDSLFIVMAGTLSIEKDGVTLWERRPHEAVGEQALIERTVRSATLIARGRVELLELDRASFEEMMCRTPCFSRNLLRILSNKLRQATQERGIRYGREERLQRKADLHRFWRCRRHVQDRRRTQPQRTIPIPSGATDSTMVRSHGLSEIPPPARDRARLSQISGS